MLMKLGLILAFIKLTLAHLGGQKSTVKSRAYVMRVIFGAALWGKNVLDPFCYQGTCNTELFNMWVQDFLVPNLKPGQVVILDNANFHKSETTGKLIENPGCTLLFLPPYSPDLNPMETFWGNFKAKVKTIISNFSNVQRAIDNVFNL